MGITERKEREKEHRREEIIDAAQKIFFQKGLLVATMDEIAEAAELSKGTLYLYYKSKEDLYLAVMLRGTEVLADIFGKVLSKDHPTLKTIANLGEAYYEFFKEHRNYFRMFYFFENPQFHKQVSPEMLQSCSGENQKVWKLVIDLIQRGIDEGVIQRDIDPKQAAVILWASSNHLMRQMDREDTYWHDVMGIDLEAAFRKANAMILESMMTEDAKVRFHELVP
ncbi:MAG TPA: TetR/AcrR family transcriptional regulator [Bacteroidota bacterium]|nr:TetR/AcrR family transcriptional regulator [Bacteroidota bacterium]